MMKLLVVTILLIGAASIELASSKGLREEFTWTRISYVWPRQRTIRQEQRGGRYASSGNSRNANRGNNAGASEFAFPGSTNAEEVDQTSGQTGGGNQGNNNNNNNNAGGNSAAPGNIPYTYETNIPMGANLWKDKLFITVPRRRLGVPSTLNYIPINSKERHNVPLIPYPNWEINTYDENRANGGSGQKLTSVYRVAVDSCDRLWFVDTGMVELPGELRQVQPTALVIIDLTTDRIIRRHVFDSSLLRPTTNLASVTIDVEKTSCDNAYAYIPDLGGYGLIVYSLRDDRSWGVTHNFFHLEPTSGEFTIGGFDFQWNDGIFSIALTDVKRDGSRDAYFHSMAGTNQYRVSTNVLKNETLATRSYHGEDFQLVGNRGKRSQTSSSALHKPSGVLFLGLVNQNALGCWNVNSGGNPQDYSVVQKDDRKMIYPCDVKIAGDDVLLLTNNMPIFLYGTLNYDETNFRVWSQNVNKAVEGTKCGGSRRSGGSGSYN